MKPLRPMVEEEGLERGRGVGEDYFISYPPDYDHLVNKDIQASANLSQFFLILMILSFLG